MLSTASTPRSAPPSPPSVSEGRDGDSGAVARRFRDARLYLANTRDGLSLRAIAVETGLHPSTVLRSVRRIESLRDDPLWDRIMERADGEDGDDFPPLQTTSSPDIPDDTDAHLEEQDVTQTFHRDQIDRLGERAWRKEAKTILQPLCEPEAFLLVANGAEMAGVFCRKNQFRRPLRMVEIAKAEEMVSRDWIRRVTSGEATSRYEVTAAGRAFLRRELAAEASIVACKGFAEAQTPFEAQHRVMVDKTVEAVEGGGVNRARVNVGETPLGWLAARKGPDGGPFLTPEEVEAGERLAADFELAQVGPRLGQDWRSFLTPGKGSAGAGRSPGDGPTFARDRVTEAVDMLGQGLSDVVVRVCCLHEGIESTEKRLGWSARSGKVVLKIALQRLADHYASGEARRRGAA